MAGQLIRYKNTKKKTDGSKLTKVCSTIIESIILNNAEQARPNDAVIHTA
jgi:hypothetical protein